MFVCTFLRSLTKDLECEKKMEQNCLDGCAFTTIILLAKQAVAAVLKKLFSTPNILFNINLALMTSMTKKMFIV